MPGLGTKQRDMNMTHSLQRAHSLVGEMDKWTVTYITRVHNNMYMLVYHSAMDWKSVAPENSYIEILPPKVLVFGGGAFLIRIRVFTRDPRELAPFRPLRTQWKDSCLGSGPSSDNEPTGAMTLDFQLPELWEINIWCLSATQSVIAAWMD